MTITLSDEFDDFVHSKLQTGHFENQAAVVAAALTAWQGDEVFRGMDRDETERLLLEAIDSPRIFWDDANLEEIVASLREKHLAS